MRRPKITFLIHPVTYTRRNYTISKLFGVKCINKQVTDTQVHCILQATKLAICMNRSHEDFRKL